MPGPALADVATEIYPQLRRIHERLCDVRAGGHDGRRLGDALRALRDAETALYPVVRP